jgi:hypothetical protein
LGLSNLAFLLLEIFGEMAIRSRFVYYVNEVFNLCDHWFISLKIRFAASNKGGPQKDRFIVSLLKADENCESLK